MYETVKLVNQVLQRRGSNERLATLEELQSEEFERPLTAQMRLAFVLLDDDLAYLLMWTPAIHNYCRPLRRMSSGSDLRRERKLLSSSAPGTGDVSSQSQPESHCLSPNIQTDVSSGTFQYASLKNRDQLAMRTPVVS